MEYVRIRSAIFTFGAVVFWFWSCSDPTVPQNGETVRIKPVRTTETAGDDADDPAIWVNPVDASQSLILGVNKAAAPPASCCSTIWEARPLQKIDGLDRPNNIDVDRGLVLQGRATDFAILTERYRQRLRVFAIDAATRRLRMFHPRTDWACLKGESGEHGAPMGVSGIPHAIGSCSVRRCQPQRRTCEGLSRAVPP